MNNIRRIQELSEKELQLGVAGTRASWHEDFRSSAYVFVGGLDSELNEGDLIQVFSQFGEVVDCHLLRDKKTGLSKCAAFIAFEDQRSTDLAVDNMNGISVCGLSHSLNLTSLGSSACQQNHSSRSHS